MNLHRIDLNLFVVFDAIYTEGGITRASQKLHLTQPAVSHALGRLREMFGGDALFEREGRNMVPTPLARSLIEPVRRALRGLELTLHEAARFDPHSSERRFTLAVRDVLESTLLPILMRRITDAAPLIDISAVRADRRSLESELAMGSIDAAIDILLPLSEQIRRMRIAIDPMVVVARDGHPEIDGGIDLDTYLRQQHVQVSSRRSGPTFEDVELSRLGLRRQVRLRCQHYFAACRVVSQTDLILTMPEGYARIANRQFGNQILPVPIAMQGLDAYLYWHASVDQEPANRWLREQLLQSFES